MSEEEAKVQAELQDEEDVQLFELGKVAKKKKKKAKKIKTEQAAQRTAEASACKYIHHIFEVLARLANPNIFYCIKGDLKVLISDVIFLVL